MEKSKGTITLPELLASMRRLLESEADFIKFMGVSSQAQTPQPAARPRA